MGDCNVLDMKACNERELWKQVNMVEEKPAFEQATAKCRLSGMILVNNGVQKNHEKGTMYLKC